MFVDIPILPCSSVQNLLKENTTPHVIQPQTSLALVPFFSNKAPISSKKPSITRRQFTRRNIEQLRVYLEEQNWNGVLTTWSAEEAYSEFAAALATTYPYKHTYRMKIEEVFFIRNRDIERRMFEGTGKVIEDQTSLPLGWKTRPVFL
ncbi:hypothetical protein J6590_035599 [Homalodisca vitripennis]|nr:hypothetical protein J6590_035599 [Homalodisca vitripennis]